MQSCAFNLLASGFGLAFIASYAQESLCPFPSSLSLFHERSSFPRWTHSSITPSAWQTPAVAELHMAADQIYSWMNRRDCRPWPAELWEIWQRTVPTIRPAGQHSADSAARSLWLCKRPCHRRLTGCDCLPRRLAESMAPRRSRKFVLSSCEVHF